MTRVDVSPEMLRWACDRAGLDPRELAAQMPQIEAWLRGERRPTLKQLERLAKRTHTPLGYLFLSHPPEERLPVQDFRTVRDRPPRRPSPELLDTIYTMQRRQAWLSEVLREEGADPLPFVRRARLDIDPRSIGRDMRSTLALEGGWASTVTTWEEAVGELRRQIEKIGVMAVINGIVGNSTRRRLDPKEFRGFALVDEYAPLIFVNGADAKSAQMFTLAHELAHIWLGSEGVSGEEAVVAEETRVERWCNQAAAEFLVPENEFRAQWDEFRTAPDPYDALARHFKVSPIVASRRALDLQFISRAEFFRYYEGYIRRDRSARRATGGGDFYRNQNTRVGELFAKQVIRAALEGRIGFKEAYDLTGLYGSTFTSYASRLGLEIPGSR